MGKDTKLEETEEMETIDIDISDEDFLKIAVMAHERDITFNQMVVIILEEYIESDGENVHLDRIGAGNGKDTGRDTD